MRAGHIRARRYHRRERAVSLADCIAAATAQQLDAAVASSDPHLLALCHDEGILVIVLPDTRGRTWSPQPGSSVARLNLVAGWRMDAARRTRDPHRANGHCTYCRDG